jgi:hypothetical protein
MSPDDFRTLALSLPEATEMAHMGHPDFRVRNKVFATLGAPDEDWAVLKLTPEQQAPLVRGKSNVFVPVSGGWGRRGYTNVYLPVATDAAVRAVLLSAWRNVAPKKLQREQDEE